MATVEDGQAKVETDLLRRLLRAVASGEGRDALQAIAIESASRGAGEQLKEDLDLAGRLADRLSGHQRREAELLALSESARDLTSLRDIDGVLHAIVRRARQLLGSEVGYLSLFDEQRNDFFVRATEGSVSADFAQIRVPQGVGICGAVARDKRPLFSSDYANDRRFDHEGTIDTGVLAENMTSILGVPLLVTDEVIGVLFVGDRIPRQYTAQEIALLDSLGAHAAVAIENARLFEQTEQALDRERAAGAQLRATTLEVQSAAEVHEQITSLLADGGDLPDLAEVLARELDGTVLLVDNELEPLCGAASDGTEVPTTATMPLRAAFRSSSAQGRTIELNGERCWAASAAGLSGSQGGVAVWRDRTPTQSETRTLERAAMMVALVLLARERVAEAEHRAMAALVEAMRTSTSSDPRRLERDAHGYGLDVSQALTILVLDVDAARGAPAVNAALSVGQGVLAEAGPDGLTVVLEGTGDDYRVGAVHDAVGLALGEDPAGVVATARPLEALPDGHRRALRGVRLLANLGRGGQLVHEHELAPYALLLGGDQDAELIRFCESLLQPLLDVEGSRSDELLRTLLTYLDLGHNTTAAAQVLHVHANTLRQRLDKISALLPGWDEPARRLDVHLALRLWWAVKN